FFCRARFGRGGVHTPFHEKGFPAVRSTWLVEALALQHTARDTFESASPAYTTRVARVNAAVAFSLALAPAAPVVTRKIPPREPGGQPTTGPNLSRGKGRFDAVLRWTNPSPEADLAGYAVVMRSTTAPHWEHGTFVGS